MIPIPRRAAHPRVLLPALLAFAACHGNLGPGGEATGREDSADEPGGSGDGDPDPGVTPEEQAAVHGLACDRIDAEPGPLHRLTRPEHENSLRDLLQIDDVGIAKLPRDIAESNGFANGESVSPALAESLALGSEVLVDRALARHPELHACDGGNQASCGRAFIDHFVTRAYRRPLTEAERARHEALYDAVRARESHREAIAAVMTAAITSPVFLYRIEVGEELDGDSELRRLSSWETAARLSYALWQTMPDDELFAAAETGALTEPEERRRQAERLLADPRARAAVNAFHEQWLDLPSLAGKEKAASLGVTFDDGLRTAMRNSTLAFTAHVFLDGPGTISDLLSSGHKFVDARLAPIYGVAPPAGNGLAELDLDPALRPGLLAEPSLLAMLAYPDQTNPIKRGEFVRTHLLCQELPSPPANIEVSVPVPRPGTSTRERFAQHREDESCAGCHRLLDPVGFGFEGFDPFGRRRDSDGGSPIDESGELVAAEGIEGPFTGLAELTDKLGRSTEVRTCFAQQWFRYTVGRHEGERDACTIAAAVNALASGEGRLRDMIPAIAASPGFVRRRAE